MTADIIFTIYQAVKPGNKTKRGPESLDTYGATAAVSMLSTRPEGPFAVAERVPSGWTVDKEVDGIGTPPHRKTATVQLPDGVEYGPYNIGGATLVGLHSTRHSANDGMGRTVYAYARECKIIPAGESWEEAIDKAIKSGVMLSIPTEDGGRESVPAAVLSVSSLC